MHPTPPPPSATASKLAPGLRTGQKRKNLDKEQQNKPLAQNKPLSKKPVKFVKASASEETDNETVAMSKLGSKAIKTTPQFQSVVSERQYGVEKYKKAVTMNTRKDEFATNPTLSVTQSGRGIGIGNITQSGRGIGNITQPGRGIGNITQPGRGIGNITQPGRGTGNITQPGRGIGTGNITQSGRGIGTGNSQSLRGRGNATSGSSSPQIMPATVCENPAVWNDSDSLSDFVIVRREYHAFSTAFSVLHESSNFSRIPVSYKWAQKGTECAVTINGKIITTGKGENKKGAREAAAVQVLEILSQHCYTLKVLKAHTAEEEVSVGEVASGKISSDQSSASGQGTSLDKPIEDNSMGSKLLKMMGWRGGGLGKEGTGITEPIRPPEVCGRGGLGHSQKKGGLSPRFRSRITAIVREFTQGCGMEDLAFSPDFTKEQRAEIHKVARRFKLKSTSHGSGDNRYLVLSRKFSAKQLICTLNAEGPTDKYELIPPKA